MKCDKRGCPDYNTGCEDNCECPNVEPANCNRRKPLIPDQTPRANVPLDRVAIKQLFEEEVQRLEDDIDFLNKKNSYGAARTARHKMLGVQGIWAILRQKGIAL